MIRLKLDSKDQHILALLQQNARLPTAEIARAVNLARSTVQERIRRLEERGMIEGYSVRLNVQLLPRPQFFSRVSVSVLAPCQAAVIGSLERIPQVYCCETVSGSVDLMLEVRAHDAAELDAVIEKISALKGVERTESGIVLREFFRRDLP
ncbi:Lrp/AsnC family transcriptional regulator [Aliamphritea hakodatensis]|uniref:Lrp/AsnC family transcriptional regulator n=1 Tax=Aliamphritea hakodatensis TaxID=2895352 RepID=UPI0022FD7791|nr:Lrp/AsnC family transcriptional regulator [Aliamphritea hakodatensis]